MNLTPDEKLDLVKLIEADKPLPEAFRFRLFADKREVELVWNGKNRELTCIFYKGVPSARKVAVKLWYSDACTLAMRDSAPIAFGRRM